MPELNDAPSRTDILAAANDLITGERQENYGEALENFTRIGELWFPILKSWDPTKPVPPSMVALLLLQLKVARLITSPMHADSAVDGAGYIALSGELAWRE